MGASLWALGAPFCLSWSYAIHGSILQQMPTQASSSNPAGTKQKDGNMDYLPICERTREKSLGQAGTNH